MGQHADSEANSLQDEARLLQSVETVVFKSSPSGMIVWNKWGRVDDMNPAAEEIFGWTREEAMDSPSMHFLFPEEAKGSVQAIFDSLIRLLLPQDLTIENLTKAGQTIWCEWRNVPLNGQGFLSIIQDITDRVQSEQTLRESEQRFRKAFLYSGNGVALLNRDGSLVDCNPELCRMLGYKRNALIGLNVEEIWESHGQATQGSTWNEIIARREDHYYTEKCLRTGDGSVVETQWILSLIREMDGSPLQVVAQIQDVTHSKTTEREMARAKELAEAMNHELQDAMVFAERLAAEAERLAQAKKVLIEAVPLVLIGINPDGSVYEWNHAAERTFNLASGDVVGTQILDLEIEWPAALIDLALQKCMTRKVSVKLEDLSFQPAPDSHGFLDLDLTPIEYVEGETGVLILAEDVTARKLLEGQLAQAQKLEAIGQLAAGVAHEINTPTQYVGDNVKFLERSFQQLLPVLNQLCALPDVATSEAFASLESILESAQGLKLKYLVEEIPSAFEEASEGLDRVKTILQAMKEFSHPGSDDVVTLDLNKALSSTLTVARNEYRYFADVETDFDLTLQPISCYAAELNQVFLNIVINAAHAIKDVVGDTGKRGLIKVKTRKLDGVVEIRISDSGTGIPESIRKRVFDPFFTTKEVGKGTGQGLAIAHSVVTKRHSGQIAFESTEGAGTTFVIQLPLGRAMGIAS